MPVSRFFFFFFFFWGGGRGGRRDNDSMRQVSQSESDSCIATPISEEGLSSREGSGSVRVLDGAGRVSSGLLAATSNIPLFRINLSDFFCRFIVPFISSSSSCLYFRLACEASLTLPEKHLETSTTLRCHPRWRDLPEKVTSLL